ncbi:uncharacterized protein MCYG_00838 [Microsporum canis CBS 113480]|uniref:Uncharacterized protein n=1 Tax=Arthroderma otae (strain ATCC MYA-4605 / CBS 113480) TaxID=554155 RepID=C5FDH6_ARTOC|nr:uncharacterized protein MCYG_00838 [Microsporum canis CBS 113480]EEQ27950.1 predicted protein [Microsporum canis CBS 113480]
MAVIAEGKRRGGPFHPPPEASKGSGKRGSVLLRHPQRERASIKKKKKQRVEPSRAWSDLFILVALRYLVSWMAKRSTLCEFHWVSEFACLYRSVGHQQAI